MNVIIRNAQLKDTKQIINLVKELNADLNFDVNNVSIKYQDLVQDSFSGNPKISFIVAIYNDSIIGFISFLDSYNIYKGSSLIIEDVFIKKEYRKLKVSLKLMVKVLNYANKKGYNLIEWIFDTNKQELIHINKKIGIEVKENVLIYKINMDAIKNKISKYNQKSEYEIRLARNIDMPAIFEIIEKASLIATETVTITTYDLMNDGFGKNSKFKILIVVEDYEIIGMLFFFEAYSTFRGKALILEKLFVDSNFDYMKIGMLLFTNLIKYASENAVKRIEFGIADDKIKMIDLLDKINIFPFKEYRIAQIYKEELERLLN